MVGEELLPFYMLAHCLINGVLCFSKAFSFMGSHLLNVDVSTYPVNNLFIKFSPLTICSRVFPIFSSIKFNVSGFMLRSLNNLEKFNAV